MSALWPSAAEAATLQFVFTSASLGRRVLLAGALFALGLAGWVLLPFPFNLPGLALVVAGHLPLWVRRQSTAPGGATPVHEEVWAPVEEGWLARVEELERRGERWDVTPWDSSNAIGCVTLAGVVLALGGGAIFLAARLGFDAFFRLGVAAQRTRAWASDRDLQRGFMAAFSYGKASLTGYVLNPDAHPTWIVALGAEF